MSVNQNNRNVWSWDDVEASTEDHQPRAAQPRDADGDVDVSSPENLAAGDAPAVLSPPVDDDDLRLLRQLADLDGWVAPVDDKEAAAFGRLEAAGLIGSFWLGSASMALTIEGYAAIGREMRTWL